MTCRCLRTDLRQYSCSKAEVHYDPFNPSQIGLDLFLAPNPKLCCVARPPFFLRPLRNQQILAEWMTKTAPGYDWSWEIWLAVIGIWEFPFTLESVVREDSGKRSYGMLRSLKHSLLKTARRRARYKRHRSVRAKNNADRGVSASESDDEDCQWGIRLK